MKNEDEYESLAREIARQGLRLDGLLDGRTVINPTLGIERLIAEALSAAEERGRRRANECEKFWIWIFSDVEGKECPGHPGGGAGLFESEQLALRAKPLIEKYVSREGTLRLFKFTRGSEVVGNAN